ncbi:MAG: D-glycero-beta-D-manno-heptose 1,7-bisphosphate 7-phosphatase [Thiolinea sp.]
MIRPEHCQLVILDRDGVINADSDQYIKSAEEWIALPGSPEAIAALSAVGLPVAVATNQSGIARGYYDEAVLEQMHAKMHGLLAERGGKIDYIAYCPHGPQDACSCRKPLPGMLNEILQHFNLRPGDCCFIGDSYRDYQAAAALGMPFYLVKSGKGGRTLLQHPDVFDSDCVYEDLAAFVAAFLQGHSAGGSNSSGTSG